MPQPPYIKEQTRYEIASGDVIAWREHAKRSEAKKTVEMGIAQLPFDTAETRSEAPLVVVVSGASAGTDLDPKEYYRFISTTGLYFNLSNVPGTAVAATTADTYLPPNVALVIFTDEKWRRIDMIQATAGGSAQLQRVLM